MPRGEREPRDLWAHLGPGSAREQGTDQQTGEQADRQAGEQADQQAKAEKGADGRHGAYSIA